MVSALVTGVQGQDGYFMCKYLKELGYDQVVGVSWEHTPEHSQQEDNIADIEKTLEIRVYHADSWLPYAFDIADPDEIYNFAGFTQVGLSFDASRRSAESNVLMPMRILEIILKRDYTSDGRLKPGAKKRRFFQPNTFEMLGNIQGKVINERTPFKPVSPYGFSKVLADQTIGWYMKQYGIYAVRAVSGNHESPRRDPYFLTRKVSLYVAALYWAKHGRWKWSLPKLRVGNIKAERDYGDARSYVKGYWLSMQQKKPGRYVFATGNVYSVEQVLQLFFGQIGEDWREYVEVDEALYRRFEINTFRGADITKARKIGWEPDIPFEQTAKDMVESDIELLGSKGYRYPPFLRLPDHHVPEWLTAVYTAIHYPDRPFDPEFTKRFTHDDRPQSTIERNGKIYNLAYPEE